MQRQSTIRRQSRTPEDDIVIKSGYSFCDIIVFAGIICCILSFLAGPPLMGLIAVPLLKEYINIHRHHTSGVCSHSPLLTNTSIEGNVTDPADSLNASFSGQNVTVGNSNDLIPTLNVTKPNKTHIQNMTNLEVNNGTRNDSHINKKSENNVLKECGAGKRKFKCELLSVIYKKGKSTIKANLYRSHKHFTKSNSQCSVFGCELKFLGEDLLHEMRSLKDGFECYYDKRNTSNVFLQREPSLALVVWFSCCSFLLVLGTFPFIACICSKIKSPWQGYFEYCTKRYTSRHEKWIDAIKQGNIFILRWTMSQKHINEEMLENYCQSGFKWRTVPLSRAAFTGQSAMAEYLLSRGAFVNYEDSYKLTPLHYACLGAQVNTLQTLISEGADFEAQDGCQRTPLLMALMLNISALDIIQCLVEAGADVSVSDKQGCTPLHYACFKGDLNAIHMIIKAGAISNSTIYLTKDTFRSSLQDTPFGTNFGFKSDLYTNTWTPMTSLLYRNSKEACRLLVAAGYNLIQDPILPRVLYSDADETMNKFFKQNMREVSSLMRLCRMWIRGHLGTRKLQQKISQLNLASAMKEYLRLERID